MTEATVRVKVKAGDMKRRLSLRCVKTSRLGTVQDFDGETIHVTPLLFDVFSEHHPDVLTKVGTPGRKPKADKPKAPAKKPTPKPSDEG